jgi:hypothetical protein
MLENARDPKSVTRSVRIYRRMISAYPHNFRSEFSEPMLQVFRDSCRRAYLDGGALALSPLWVRTGRDYFTTLVEEYARRGTAMTREKFYKLSGWGLVLAAVSLLLSFLPEADRILDGLYQIFGVPASPEQHNLYQSLSEGVRSLPFPVAILLITFGLFGLNVRYGDLAGKRARIALGIGITGGIAALVISVGMAIGFEIGRQVMNISMAFMFAGLFFFGIAALRNKPMPRGNGLPILAGIWWPLLTVQAYVFPQMFQQLNFVPAWVSITIFSIMGFALATLGYVLQADAPRVGGTFAQQV